MRRNSEGRVNFQALVYDRLFRIFFFVVFLYTLYNLFLSQYSIFRVVELKRSGVELNAQISRQRTENIKTEQLLELIRENPEHFKEKFAREYMQLQKDGEYILLLSH